MNRLELNPPLLIMTMGYPGAGKTFFSRQFAELHKLPCLSEDRMRFELFENPQFNNDEQDIISRVFDHALEQVMKTGATVVCDGDFSGAKSRQRIEALAKSSGYRTLIIWLQTDINTSGTRALNRDRRNLDSKYAFNLSQDTFNKLSSQLRRPSEKEDFVVISGKHAFKGQALTVLRKITELYANGIVSQQTSSPISGRLIQ